MQPFLEAAKYRNTVIYGITGNAGHDGELAMARKNLERSWLLGTGELRRHPSGVTVAGVSEPTEAAVNRGISRLETPDGPNHLQH